MDKPGADTDRQELEAAIVRLTEGKAGKDPETVYYRNLFEVIREEYRLRRNRSDEEYAKSHPIPKSLEQQRLEWKPIMIKADDADMASFEEAAQSWQKRAGQKDA
ncbi:hypothetical protein [Noviherbaspirillum massiliense]|uniref:hypothetical protein n=1 Tax=Noviherbaspirillum massiliense TaxID=1465823 RepID=UPI0002D9F2A6|nr:hypothetical protein [Noviherbaspirillum massiliense]